jgi:hypothetical protein
MKLVAWLILAALGMGVTIWAYDSAQPAHGPTPISSGMIVVARSSSRRFDEPIPLPSMRAGVQQLPVSGISAMLAMSSGGGGDAGRGLRFQLSEKLIQVALKEAGISESSLAWGKLPRAGRNEVLAGAQVAHQDQCEVAETVYKVTGGLPREAGLFARSYVLPESERTGEHGDEGDASFRAAVLIPLSAEQLANQTTREQLDKRFPTKDYDSAVCLPSLAPRAFYASLLGEAVLLLGGSGFLIALYAAASTRVRWAIVRDPLEALTTHRRLNWGVHLAYFSLYLVMAALIYGEPDLWNALQATIQSSLHGGNPALEFAGKAYGTGNIAWAALVTFVINFFGGAIAYLTVPSCIIPGSAAILAAFRAALWGLLLAPATSILARAMLPHSLVLLLEGEGYILSTFFGLMLAVYVFRSEPESTLWRRYARSLVLNLKGSLLVALVLAVAAIYEAVEVIWMLKSAGQA